MPLNSKIRIAVADDHTLFRQSISGSLIHEHDLDVVFGAENGAELIYNLVTNAHLYKGCDIEDLLDAIQMTHRQGYYFTDDFPKEMINKIMNKKSVARIVPDFIISEREIEIIRLICLEKCSKEIAEELQIAERTVQNHRYQISKKIGTSSSAGILVYALINGIVTITGDGKVVFE